jgi:hypothetical protein
LSVIDCVDDVDVLEYNVFLTADDFFVVDVALGLKLLSLNRLSFSLFSRIEVSSGIVCGMHDFAEVALGVLYLGAGSLDGNFVGILDIFFEDIFFSVPIFI